MSYGAAILWSESELDMTKDFARLKADLQHRSDRDFERAALSLLRILFPKAIQTRTMKGLDKLGIDLFEWADAGPLPVGAQCKGFEVTEREVGKSQVDQCVKSIVKFGKTSVTVDHYVLIINRRISSVAIRTELNAALAQLVKQKRAARAELWDLPHFLRAVQDGMRDRALASIKTRGLGARHQPFELITHVPLRQSTLEMDQYRLRSASEPTERLGDPAVEAMPSGVGSVVVLTAEAGCGKTTTAERALRTAGRSVIAVPASAFDLRRTDSTNDFLLQCFDEAQLLDDVEGEDRERQRTIARNLARTELLSESPSVALLIDGVDESTYFTRKGGLQTLFNHLREVRAPVLLTVRRELWDERKADFETSFGELAKDPLERARKRRTAKLVELPFWTETQIVALATRFRDSLTEPSERDGVDAFISSVENGDYETLYGDIPKRPLFLQFILENAADGDLQTATRMQLVDRWIAHKIERDYHATNRAPIIDGIHSLDDTMTVAFLAMARAARVMTRIEPKALELRASCSLHELRAADERLARLDPTGVGLNTVLVPLPRRKWQDVELRFAHRVFHELFLARQILEAPAAFTGVALPPGVAEWLEEARRAAEGG